MKIIKREYWYFGAGLAFILLWVLVLRGLLEEELQIFPSFIAMLIYNLGFFAGTVILSYVISGKFNFKWVGLAFIVGLAWSLIAGTPLVNTEGVINTAVEHYYVAEDVGFAQLYSLFIPKAWLYEAVYIFTPVLIILLFPIFFLKPRQISRVI